MDEDRIEQSNRGLTRRQFLSRAGKVLLAAPLVSVPLFEACSGTKSAPATTTSTTYQGTDEQLLEEIERAAFRFFWEQAHPQTGLIKDRASVSGTDTYDVASIASIGFGLTALCIADSRGYMASDDVKARVKLTLNSMLNMAAGYNGFFFHFLDWSNGKRMWSSELSSIDTSVLMCGVLTARQYFINDPDIPDLATQLYDAVNWPWMQNNGDALSMGWKPESGFLTTRWDHYCELMMIYLLGIGSTTYPLSPDTWNSWTRPVYTYSGYTYISAGDPLFTHQFSHAWFDFRKQRDAYTNYFDNSVTATKAHKAFCQSLRVTYSDYSDSLWGITASDSLQGYTAWGGPPATGQIDGSVVPCAPGGSIPFQYGDCMKVLRNIRNSYPTAWTRYGYTDVFNPLKNWYNPDVIGIDVGITMLMAENQRTGFVWKYMMQNPEAVKAMQLAGFHPE